MYTSTVCLLQEDLCFKSLKLKNIKLRYVKERSCEMPMYVNIHI